MYNNYSLLKFQKLVDTISIDIWYRVPLSGESFKEEYYSMERIAGASWEAYIDYDGTFVEEGYTPDYQIWNFGFNKLSPIDFFNLYSEMEKNLLDEMLINSKTFDEFDEYKSMYTALRFWLDKKVNSIRYIQETELFECDFIHYCETFDKITFKNNYDYEIQEFLKELKHKLIQTYCHILENLPAPIINSNLKWNKSKVDLIELMAALVESKSIFKDNIPVTKEYLVEFLSKMFLETDLTNWEKDLTQAKRRKREKAPYLKLLVKTFEEFAEKKV
jgi:hypothetical protein